MKKKVIIGIIIVAVILFTLGIITNYIDSGRVTTGHEPKCCIKIVSQDGSKITYWGLGYKVIRYVGVSPNEPYENNIGVKMGNWFMKFDLPENNYKAELKAVVVKVNEKSMLVMETEKEQSDYGYSVGFRDLSENRILVNKKDKTSFTSEDFDKIKELSNVDYIVEDDITIDGGIPISRGDLSLHGNMLDIKNFKGELDYGRMPESDDEIILKIRNDHFYIEERMDDVLNKTFSILKSQGINAWSNETAGEVTIVGIETFDDVNDYDCKFYVSKSILNQFRADINKNYSEMKILLNDKYVQFTIEPNEYVEKGKAIVDDELKYQFKNYRIINKPLNIYVKNIYYNEELELSISNTYTKYNIKRLTGLDKYDNNRFKIFINTDDYNSLYNKPTHQSSVYVKDAETIDETMNQLDNLGLNPKKVTDFKVNQGETSQRIIKIIKVVVTIILIIVLFFEMFLLD